MHWGSVGVSWTFVHHHCLGEVGIRIVEMRDLLEGLVIEPTLFFLLGDKHALIDILGRCWLTTSCF